MNKVAIAYLTKDRVELSKQTFARLNECEDSSRFDTFAFDGSVTPEGQAFFADKLAPDFVHKNVRGGPDAAVAFALTTLLAHPAQYTHIGLCENDVLLHPDWFGPTMALFERGAAEGLNVGAVSPRAYEDRILFQRYGFAVMHNLGWGVQIMTRAAAALSLQAMRTGSTIENRRTFCQLTGLDIGTYWAFGAGEHALCADWHNDAILATSCGFASLALTPSPVEMIGQTPPLAEQGLVLATTPVEARRDNKRFERYGDKLVAIFGGVERVPGSYPLPEPNGAQVFFAHQLGALFGRYTGDWKLKWCQGFGPFAWKADSPEGYTAYMAPIAPQAEFTVSGSCQVLVSGGEKGGQVLVEDLQSGYQCDPVLSGEATQGVIGITVPAGIAYRRVRVTAKTPGVAFHGVKVFEPQPLDTNWRFDHSVLPPV